MAMKETPPDNEGEKQDESNGDDNFGLPEIEYKPLDTDRESVSGSETTSTLSSDEQKANQYKMEKEYSYTPMEEPKSKAPVIIALVIGLVLLVGGFLVYQYVYKPKAEKEKRELAAAKAKKAEEARLAKEAEAAAEAERKRLADEQAAANAKPIEGSIETLNERTGRYYVVITSAVDGDLTMDYAKKLSTNGTSVRIIPPFGKSKFNRLTLGDYGTFAEAQSSADALKPTYGDALWVIKY